MLNVRVGHRLMIVGLELIDQGGWLICTDTEEITLLLSLFIIIFLSDVIIFGLPQSCSYPTGHL